MKLSLIILTKNEEKMLPGCLLSIRHLADEIIIIDDQSTDKTIAVAKKFTEKIFSQKMTGFAQAREFGLKKAQGDWVFYLDADERVTEALRKEISEVVKTNSEPVAYYLKRRNIFLGKEQKEDQIERLFKKENLSGWYGQIHESPKVNGSKAILKNYLIHLTHRNLSSMLLKTLAWSKYEADLRYQAGHPAVVWWRLLRLIGAEFYRQIFVEKVYRFGTEGWLEGLFQVFSLFITYFRLWEKQRPEPLSQTYEKIDHQIAGKSS